MAKERIYITTFEPGFECPIEEHCTDFHKQCKNCDAFPTREQAIEKIEAELLLCDLSTMDNKEIAEIALKALLEDKND